MSELPENIPPTQESYDLFNWIYKALLGFTSNKSNGINPQKTGQTTSYAVGDDGYYQHGRPATFFTLSSNNTFGNLNRFTNDKGGSVYNGSDGSTANYVIDNATGYGWCITLQTATNWSNALALANAFTLGVYSAFFLPNANEVLTIMQYSAVCLNYPPFNLNPFSAAQIWSSTTNYSNTASAIRVSYQTFPVHSSVAKTASQPYLLCRIHFQ